MEGGPASNGGASTIEGGTASNGGTTTVEGGPASNAGATTVEGGTASNGGATALKKDDEEGNGSEMEASAHQSGRMSGKKRLDLEYDRWHVIVEYVIVEYGNMAACHGNAILRNSSVCSHFFTFALEHSVESLAKRFSELKLVIDNRIHSCAIRTLAAKYQVWFSSVCMYGHI